MTKKRKYNNVEVEVDLFYQPQYSNPDLSEFMFAYRLTFTNHHCLPVKLISRHWNVFDSDGRKRVVEGNNVVGMNPIIEPSEEFSYISGCNLHTEMGVLEGGFVFQLGDNEFELFEVLAPRLEMIATQKLN